MYLERAQHTSKVHQPQLFWCRYQDQRMHPSSRLPESPETEQDHDSVTGIHLFQVKKPLSYLQWKRANKMELWEKKQFRLTGWVTALAVWQQIQPADHSDDEKIVHLYSPDVKYFIMKIFGVGQKMTHQITVDNFLITKKKKVYISEQVNASSVSFVIVLMYCLHRYYGLCYTK